MSPGRVVVTAPAKINLSLGVGPVRPDGFHPLATVYQAIGLYDEVTARRGDGWSLSVAGDGRIPVHDVPTDERNIAVRAALLLAEHHGRDPDVEIVLHKGIPVAGGMAGGSADAAATLLACDTLWGTRTPKQELMELAAVLGSDVPFALVGGTAIGAGRGEVVTPAMTRGQLWWVVLESDTGLSTPAVYREFDRLHAGEAVADPEIPDPLMAALRSGDVEELGRLLSNDLQAAAFRLRPELERALALGRAESACGAIVSGSGPTCLFLCARRAHAAEVAAGLDDHGFGVLSLAPGPVPGARVVG
ncbi:MAG: 4-(cytidine 5'-diphospho)-2-C-methyl-D-erythritol kinase [Nocardioidaceae bacterium]